MRKICSLVGVFLLTLVLIGSAEELTVVLEPENPQPNEEVTLTILNESGLSPEIRGEVEDPERQKIANIFPHDEGTITIIPQMVGRYWIRIRERDALNFTVKKEMWWSGPLPENPRVGEAIGLGVPRGVGVKILDSQGNLYKTCVTQLGYIGGSSVNVTVEDAGTYTVVLGELNQDWWTDNFTLVVRERKKLEIALDSEKAEVGRGVMISITSEGDDIEDAKIIIKTPEGGVEEKITSSSGRIVYLPSESGGYVVQVEKEGYLSDEKTFEAYNTFNLEVIPKEPGAGDEILLKVRSQVGSPVYGAMVSLEDNEFSTSMEGEVKFSVGEMKEYEILVEKDGFWDLTYKLAVLAPLTLELSSQEIEIGEGISLEAFDQKGEKIPGVKFTIIEPDGVEMETEKGVYTPSKVGKYGVLAIKYGYTSQNKSFQVNPHPLEIEKNFKGNTIVISVLSRGNPVPGIKVVVSGSEEELTVVTDEEGKVEAKVKEGEITVTVNPQEEDSNYPEEVEKGYVKNEYSLSWPLLIIILIVVGGFLATKKGGFEFKKEKKEPEEKSSIRVKRGGTSLGGA